MGERERFLQLEFEFLPLFMFCTLSKIHSEITFLFEYFLLSYFIDVFSTLSCVCVCVLTGTDK